MSDQHPEKPEPSLPDDVWERFARDTEREIRASAPKEPSARARMVTQRLRQQDAQGIRPDGWRAPPAAGARPLRRRTWTVLGLLLALAVAVVAMKPSLIPGDPFGTGSGPAPATEPPAETAPPTAPPSAAAPGTPTVDHPFAGSPALHWADGESGIVLPGAETVGSLTKAQVATALQQTKTLLVDANLNPKTLLGARPMAALGVLDPKQSDVLADLNRSLSTPGEKYDPLMLFSRFDPREVRLVGKVVKVRGRITFARGEQASVRVHADYTFVYPVSRGDSTEVTRTVVRRVVETELADPAKYTVTPGRLQLVRYEESAGNSACGVHDGFLHPQFPSATPTGAAPSGPTTDPYDRSGDLRRGDSGLCGTASRT
ncbi:hypothetical protein [Streptomyces sp. TP-A0356]|uniref:hypothetical protein n=1 Tax=Streptomyces sp. TP-A0356 TaxID=1359208 RepID=UPI0006E1546A|nr:hypothetical protein [Streptomyces sp. TP-A0356]